MTLALLYWILMLLWLVLGLWGSWPLNAGNLRASGGSLILFLLLLILGWQQFGAPVK